MPWRRQRVLRRAIRVHAKSSDAGRIGLPNDVEREDRRHLLCRHRCHSNHHRRHEATEVTARTAAVLKTRYDEGLALHGVWASRV